MIVFPDDTEDDDNVREHDLPDVVAKLSIPISVGKLTDVKNNSHFILTVCRSFQQTLNTLARAIRSSSYRLVDHKV